jgi:hypothetical protein
MWSLMQHSFSIAKKLEQQSKACESVIVICTEMRQKNSLKEGGSGAENDEAEGFGFTLTSTVRC